MLGNRGERMKDEDRRIEQYHPLILYHGKGLTPGDIVSSFEPIFYVIQSSVSHRLRSSHRLNNTIHY